MLINNPLLVTTFWNRYGAATIFVLQQVVELDDPEDFEQRQPVQEDINAQIQNLDEALTLVEREMPQES